MNFKGTKGPLFVRASENWPFDLVTYNSNLVEVFRTRLPAHSTKMKSFEDALNGIGFNRLDRNEVIEMNTRALADEVLRAKAPEMLEMLEEILYGLEIAELDNTDAYKKAKQLIKEATEINQ